MYGADLVKVPGTREDTAQAAWNAAMSTFYASHNWNPWFLAGMKTVAYEIAEQLGWETPDWVITPAGGGSLLAGLFLGFVDLLDAGITKTIPRLAAVQSAACDPIYRAWMSHADDIAAVEKKPTAAEGISVAKPVRGKAILQAVRESGGVVRTVNDDGVWNAIETLGRSGIYVEPTSGAAPAALAALREEGLIAPDDRVVVLLTGSGLKATDKIVEHFGSRVHTAV
jgi:threonine synthase